MRKQAMDPATRKKLLMLSVETCSELSDADDFIRQPRAEGSQGYVWVTLFVVLVVSAYFVSKLVA